MSAKKKSVTSLTNTIELWTTLDYLRNAFEECLIKDERCTNTCMRNSEKLFMFQNCKVRKTLMQMTRGNPADINDLRKYYQIYLMQVSF